MVGAWLRCAGPFRALLVLLALGMAAPAVAVDLKMATVAPDNSHWMREMRAGAAEIQKRTAGRVTMKFYPGGVMGNDAQVLRKIRVGQLQGGAFTAGGLADRYGALNLYGLPFLFRSLDEVDAIRAKLDRRLLAGLEEAGFVSFGFVEGGFANLLSNEPVRTLDDLKRKKVWVPEGDQIDFLAMQTLGLSPVMLPITDVLTGLQTGLIEIAFASPVAALVLQWHTKTKYITDLPISYSMGVFAIERNAFERLAPEDREAVRAVMTDTMGRLDRDARSDNDAAEKVLLDSGLELVPVDPADVGTWREAIAAMYPTLRERPDVPNELFDELLAMLADYRRTHP